MKFSIGQAIALLPALASGTLLLRPVTRGNDTLRANTVHEVLWLQDQTYNLTLELIKKSDDDGIAWRRVETLFSGRINNPCNGSYIWNIGNNHIGEDYALHITGDITPAPQVAPGTSYLGGYADSTDYFDITSTNCADSDDGECDNNNDDNDDDDDDDDDDDGDDD